MMRALDANDHAEALRLLRDPAPPLPTGGKTPVLHKAQRGRSAQHRSE